MRLNKTAIPSPSRDDRHQRDALRQDRLNDLLRQNATQPQRFSFTPPGLRRPDR